MKSGNIKHIGFYLNNEKAEDSRCIDILNNLPKGYNVCSFIRKAIIFYSKHGNMASEKNESLSSEEKLDLILSKLDSLSAAPVPQSVKETEQKPKTESKKAPKKKEVPEVKVEEAKIEPEELVDKTSEESTEEEPAPTINITVQKDEEPEEKAEDRIEIDADADIDDDNYDAIMSDFFDDNE